MAFPDSASLQTATSLLGSSGEDLDAAINADTSSVLALGRIGITAQYLNINGLVQSGVDKIQLYIDSSFRGGSQNKSLTDDDGNPELDGKDP